MGRPRTGSLELRKGTWHLRFTVTATDKDGRTVIERRIANLRTTDKTLAEAHRKTIVEALESGALVGDAMEAAREKAATVAAYFGIWNEPRIALGVQLAKKQEGYFRLHVEPLIGSRKLVDIRPHDIRGVLDDALGKGLSRGTVTNIRTTLLSMFEHAYDAELISDNPVKRAKVQRVKVKKKPRAILSDEEIERLLRCVDVPLYFRLMCLVARAEGGMRAGDVNAWDWQSIDLLHFAKCIVPRSKTGDPQELAMPPALGMALRAWWEESGRPTHGPVFPVMQGRRKGKVRAYGTGFGSRLRKWLLVAGVTRHELHHETAHAKPVDFHSFRRSFATALAEAGLNEQRAMRLTGHTSGNVHRRYVMETDEMKQIPAEAVPQLSAETLDVLASRVAKRSRKALKP